MNTSIVATADFLLTDLGSPLSFYGTISYVLDKDVYAKYDDVCGSGWIGMVVVWVWSFGSVGDTGWHLQRYVCSTHGIGDR